MENFENEIQSKLGKDQIPIIPKNKTPPYYPDTPIVRKTVARFHDCVTVMDQEVGELLEQLKEDGLAENTIVFFFSDHGSGAPRHKRRPARQWHACSTPGPISQKWQHLAPFQPGEKSNQLISFVDFGPTVLNLTGTLPHPTCRADHFWKIPKRKENMSTGTVTGSMRCEILPVRFAMKNTLHTELHAPSWP